MTRRIVTAREQVEMLAPWLQAATRRVAFDWKVKDRYPQFGPEARSEEAKLENGHTLQIGSGQWGGPDPHHMFWNYHIGDHEGNTLGYGGFEDDGRPSNPRIRSAEEAKAQAEEHYRQLFPIGTNTGPHDSGVDYSDLNTFRDYS